MKSARFLLFSLATSMKSARFLLFSLAISCFLIGLSFYIIGVVKANAPFHQETHFYLQFNSLGFKGDLSTSSISKDSNFNFGRAGKGKDIRAASDAVASESRGAADEIKMVNNSSHVASNDSKLLALAVKYYIPPADTHATSIPGINPLDLISEEGQPQDKDKMPPFLRAEVPNGNKQQDISNATSEKVKTSSNKKKNAIEENSKGECDVTKGTWVFDDSYPLYTNKTCPYIDEGFNCQTNGRMDKDYMKWRWQPKDCSIPRFNATRMLELIRGKRLVFVGDSLNRNQFESMLCLLMRAIKDPKKVYETHVRRIGINKGYSFKFVDYQCSVEYYVAHFLVRESKARIGKKMLQTLRIDTIDRGSSRWRGADILVFNNGHWWSHQKTKAGINYYQEGDHILPRLEVPVAFRRGVTTWASWVDKYVNPRKTRVFFRSWAPSHFSGGQWNSGGHCKEAFRPTNIVTAGRKPAAYNGIVEQVTRQMKTPVTILSITELSTYRIDGHPSVYGRKSTKSGVEDCSHWCLPGVPDSWNELLYYYMHS